MDICRARGALGYHTIKGRGGGGAWCLTVRWVRAATYVMEFRSRLMGNLRCSSSCETPESPSAQPVRPADLRSVSPSQTPWGTTTRQLIIYVPMQSFKMCHHMVWSITHKERSSGLGTAVWDCCRKKGGKDWVSYLMIVETQTQRRRTPQEQFKQEQLCLASINLTLWNPQI